jgi:hypothetical protein
MFNQLRNKILKSQIKLQPFPYIFIKDVFDEDYVSKLNSFLPSYRELVGSGVMFQSESKSKKTILPSSPQYKKLYKNKEFKNLNKNFEKLKEQIIFKFNDQINKYIKKKIDSKKLKYHSSYSVMVNGYKKSAHLDRRDHLIHMIYYSDSNSTKGGEIILNKISGNKNNEFDIFPPKNLVKVYKKYKVTKNCLIIILNVPWAYHSVNFYKGKKDRKYFYMVYDFPIKKSGSIIKNRKKGFNDNGYWVNKVSVKSNKRKNSFLTE